jgi:hypothetical protein
VINTKIKSIEEIKANYTSGATVAPQRYAARVATTTGVIAAGVAAEALWASQMQAAITAKSRANALSKVTDAQWQEAAKTKGAARIGPGMQAAVDKQATKFTPYQAVLAGLTLSARTADPATNVTNRVIPIATALHAKKVAIQAGRA